MKPHQQTYHPHLCTILTFNGAGHLNWRGDKCAHYWTFLLDPVSPAPHPCDGSRTPRRSRSLHPGSPTPQWRGGQHLAHATSLLCRRAAAALVDVEESQLENLLKIGCLRSRPPHPWLLASSNRIFKEATAIGIKHASKAVTAKSIFMPTLLPKKA